MNIVPTSPWTQATASTLPYDDGHLMDTDELYAPEELHRYLLNHPSHRPDIRSNETSVRITSSITPEQVSAVLIDHKSTALYMSGFVGKTKTSDTAITIGSVRPLTHIDYCGVQTTIEAVEFSIGNGLEHAMTKAIKLARKHFRISGVPSFYLEQDPEDGDQFIVLEIQVESPQGDALHMYKAYARDWTRDMHLPDMTLVRLIYNIN